MENLPWIKQVNPLSYPESIAEIFDKAVEQITLHVEDAALCGSSSASFLGPKSETITITTALGLGGDDSDEATYNVGISALKRFLR